MKGMLNTRQMGEIIIRVENRKYNKDLALGEKQLSNPMDTKVKLQVEEGYEKQAPGKKVKIEED
jgi:hypothetical protein